jgi:hypothetical protein
MSQTGCLAVIGQVDSSNCLTARTEAEGEHSHSPVTLQVSPKRCAAFDLARGMQGPLGDQVATAPLAR